MDVSTANAFRVFISHNSTQKVLAAELKDAFIGDAISGFVAHEDIEPTAAWQDEIERALESCDALIAILSSDFHGSKWTDQEVGIAIGRKVPVVSIRYGLDPYGFIGKYQAYKPDGKAARQIAIDIADIFMRDPRTAPKMSRAMIHKFAKTGSFDMARRRAKRLESLPTIDAELAMVLREAITNNDQIASAHGVPESITQLLARHGV